MAIQIDKREILQRVASGENVGYTPAAFFLHFDPACHKGQAAITKHQEFFSYSGMDFVKIQLELPWPKVEVQQPKDWYNLPLLDRDFFAPQVEVVKGLVTALGSKAMVVLTLYSPFMVACEMAGAAVVDRDLSRAPEDAAVGISRATQSLEILVQECIDAGLDGFYHSTQGAEVRRLTSIAPFDAIVKPHDLALMSEINEKCAFNFLHVCDYHRGTVGGYASLEPFLDYPGQIVNCSTEFEGGNLSPKEIADTFGRTFMGGMNRLGALATGTTEQVRTEAETVLSDAPTPFILGADCTVPANTNWENIKTAIDVAHSKLG